MSNKQPKEVEPHVWTFIEANASGYTAFRIGIQPGNNPFTGDLSRNWLEGWQDAAAADTSPRFKHRDYYERPNRGEREDYDNNPRRGHGNREDR